MHTTLYLIKSLYVKEDKPTPDEVSNFADFDKYFSSVSEFREDQQKIKAEDKDRFLRMLGMLGQEHDGRKFEFNRHEFEVNYLMRMMDLGYEPDKGLANFHEKIDSINRQIDITYPVAYQGTIYKSFYEFLNNVAQEPMSYEIVDVYDAHL